ncbi:hypothetical protein BH24ACI4_BH24ACI4_23660 [soil metagenome]
MTLPADWERLRALFEGTLALPPAERAAFLHDNINGDDDVLRCEVESLLVAHNAAESFLHVPLDASARAAIPGLAQEDRDTNGAPRLSAGRRLGVFEILEPLGAGGMGEVYRARDTRLDRFVAIKVLTARLEVVPRGRERFEREARAISKLSHPHICTVHDVGSEAVEGREVPFLVMELLDGETLAVRLSRGPLPVDDALTCAIDIADALTAAHAEGIVHRDLKPANVMMTRSGVKLLDFGLAQLRGSAGAAAADSSAGSLTTPGMVFGTLPYMSPEGLRGEPADARSDIFALGVLLHEMLTGSRPFAADSQAGLIAAILEHHPRPLHELQPLAPAVLDRIVDKCLAKHPDDRWQSAHDLRDELRWTFEDVRETRRPAAKRLTPAPAKGKRAALLPALTMAAALLAGLLGWQLTTRPQPSRLVTHLSLNFPPGVTLDIPINSTSFAVAPDGTRVAYVGLREGRRSLYLHALADPQSVEIAGTAGASKLTFSPGGEWLAFVQGNAVRKLPVAGGPVQAVCDCAAPQMVWGSDGRLLLGGLGRPISELGKGNVTKLAPGEEGHYTPVVTADGSLLFTVLRGGWHSQGNSVEVWSAEDGAARQLVPNATSPQMLDRDTLIYAQGHAFFAASVDPEAMRVIGEPRALGLRVQPAAFSAAPMYALAGNGTLVYAEPARGRRLVWIDRQGREEPVNAEERMYSHLRLSPDGTRVATYQPDGDRDLWVFGLRSPSVLRLTSGPARDVMPVWSADGSRIYFTTAENKVSWIPADRSREGVTLFEGPPRERVFPLSISRDETELLVQWDQMPSRIDQRVLRLGPTPQLTRLLAESGSERDGRLSPDGRWLAYQSDESAEGREGYIMVRPYPDVHAQRWVISSDVGRQPIWSRDGSEVFYRAEDGTVMAVPVKTAPRFWHGTPVPVVRPRQTLSYWSMGPTYDVAPDGRFLFIKAPELDIHSLQVVLNWDVAVKSVLAGGE